MIWLFWLCKPSFNQTRSGGLAAVYSALTEPTTQLAIQFNCLQLWSGISGDMVCNQFCVNDHRLIFDLTGVPVAWMLASNTQYETIAYFLNLVQVWNPDVWPTYCMTDRDQAQMAAMEAIYPQSHMLLC